jgi:hypothetical protein
MKKPILKFIAFIVPLFLMTACLFEEENVFDKSSALRMDEAIEADMALLASAENGWLVDYYPEKSYGMGGYAMHWKFSPDGTATIACEATVNGVPAQQAATSLWDVKPEQAPVLSFDTYNTVLQYFCQPSQADIDGLAGDYEFIIRKNIDMGSNLLVTGKRNGNKLILRPVAANEDPTAYLAQVNNFAASVATYRNFDFYVNGTSVGHSTFANTSKAGLKVRTVDIVVAAVGSEEGIEATRDTTLAFTYTPNGFRFNEPVTIHGVPVQTFVWNEAGQKYTCTDPGVSVEWIYLPPFTYNSFIGDFTLKYGGTALATSSTIYSTLNVTITADVPGESYIIKGLLSPENESQYTIRLRYDATSGLVFDAQKLGTSGADEIWAAMAFWTGTTTTTRAVPSYSSLKSTNFVPGTSSYFYGTGYSFSLSNNSNGGYPGQPSYIAYGVAFRTYAPGTTGSANGANKIIGAFSDGHRGFNISLIKK